MSHCFVCSKEVGSSAEHTCSTCRVATYCSAECRRVATETMRHGEHCHLLSVPLGFRVYNLDNERARESVDDAESAVYQWFKQEMLRLDPNLVLLPAVNNDETLDAPTTYPGCPTVRAFFETRLKPLMLSFFAGRVLSRKHISFLDGNAEGDAFLETVFEYAEENIEFYNGRNSVVLSRPSLDSDGDDDTDDRFEHTITEFVEFLYYLFYQAIQAAFKFTTERQKRQRSENNEEVIGLMHAEVHATKRQRRDEMIRAIMRKTGMSLADIPTEIRLLVANYLPARDALRLYLRTVAHHGDLDLESRTQQIVKLLYERDFQQPLTAAAKHVSAATLAESKKLRTDILTIARASPGVVAAQNASESSRWTVGLALRMIEFLLEWLGIGSLNPSRAPRADTRSWIPWQNDWSGRHFQGQLFWTKECAALSLLF